MYCADVPQISGPVSGCLVAWQQSRQQSCPPRYDSSTGGRPTSPRVDAEPKTDAGKRTVVIPPHVMPVLAEHVTRWAGPERVFVGRPMRGDAVRQAFDRARRKADMPGFRFHDLRHTGQTLAAATGATVKDLMRRLGHASPVASYRYLHAVDGRDAEIATALSALAAHGDPAKLPKSIVAKH